jgi:hypothetical protein
MKKTLILVALILFPSKYLLGQAKLHLNEVSIRSICHVTHYVHSDCPNEWSDNNWDKYEYIGFEPYDFIDSLKRVGDQVQFFSGPNGYNTISFVFDSIHNRINNFIAIRGNSGDGDGQESFSFLIDSSGFTVNQDTIIVTWTNAKLSSFYYDCEYSMACNTVLRGHYGYSQTATPVDSTFSGELQFIISHDDAVSSNTSTTASIVTFNDVLHQSTHFSFPSSDHTQPLLIYDILGREVKRIEIPSGVSEYSLPQGQLPSGCYFARLGNMNAKFMVN